MKVLTHAIVLAFSGLVAGAVHSYYAPFTLRPANNPGPSAMAAPAGAPPVEAAPSPVEGASQPREEAARPTPPAPTPPIQSSLPNYFITLERAKELFDKGRRDGTVYFVDARPLKDYAAGHVAGATHMLPGFGGPVAQRARNYFPGQTVVVYCHGATCTDSEAVMVGLQNLKCGIGAIYIMKDGFDPWKERGWPVEAGPDPLGS